MECIYDSSLRGDVEMETDAEIEIPTVPLYLKNSPGKGRGVFVNIDVAYGTLLHISPLLLIPSSKEYFNSASSEEKNGSDIPVERIVLSHYTYTFDSNTQAVALGLGSMFNHSTKNNVGFIMDKKNLLIRYFSASNISKGTELCINYGNHLWFAEDRIDSEEESGKFEHSTLSEFSNPLNSLEL